MLKLDLNNRIALVTGGSSQLGRAISRTLADCGANVAVHYVRSAERAESLAQEIREAGGEAMAVQADVGDQVSVFAMRDAVTGQLGAPDIIVNNAVHQYDWVSVLDQATEDYESQFRTCTLQNVLMAKAFVPAMIKKTWGRVIAINTECTMQCGPSMSAYASGKGGQDRMLRVLAREVGEHQVTVNQVAPGWMISDQDREKGTEKQPGYEASVALGRRGNDQEIANTVAFLASDLAAFITGTFLPVCGGNVMPCV
jgi:3-oxoacyl-[acyl-carrier protein] reductase